MNSSSAGGRIRLPTCVVGMRAVVILVAAPARRRPRRTCPRTPRELCHRPPAAASASLPPENQATGRWLRSSSRACAAACLRSLSWLPHSLPAPQETEANTRTYAESKGCAKLGNRGDPGLRRGYRSVRGRLHADVSGHAL